jgi:transcriptional regulator with XRE-family HTH domain
MYKIAVFPLHNILIFYLTIFMVNRVHNKIRLIRIEKNLSQEYIATCLNISQSYYAKIENGKKEMSIKMFFDILKILEVDILSFVSELK